MSRKMSVLEKIEVWSNMDKTTIQIILAFIVIGICAIGFSRYNQVQNERQPDLSMYTESTKIGSIEYEKIFGYAPLDSAVPPVTGIKVNYSYQVDNQIFKAKQTFYKKGFRKIMNAINNNPTQLEVKYKLSNPEESIITIRKIVEE